MEKDNNQEKQLTKEKALAKCADLHEQLLTCMSENRNDFRNPLCFDQQKEFWDCYREARGTPNLGWNFSRIFGAGDKKIK